MGKEQCPTFSLVPQNETRSITIVPTVAQYEAIPVLSPSFKSKPASYQQILSLLSIGTSFAS